LDYLLKSNPQHAESFILQQFRLMVADAAN